MIRKRTDPHLPVTLRHSVWFTETRTPVSTTNRNSGKFGSDDGTSDGSGDFLGAFNTKSNVAVAITNNYESLEACTLTGGGLLLHRADLHNLILHLFSKKVLDDLVFLDGKCKEVDFFHTLNLTGLYKT